MELSTTLKLDATKLQSFSNNWCNFHLDRIKGISVQYQLKMLGMVSKQTVRISNHFKSVNTKFKDSTEKAYATASQGLHSCNRTYKAIFAPELVSR